MIENNNKSKADVKDMDKLLKRVLTSKYMC